MIFVDLSEGLGNQMFQYAFARNIQEITGDSIYLDARSYERNKGQRSFSLNNFILNENVFYGATAKEYIWDVYAKLYRKLLRKRKVDFYNPDVMKGFEKKGNYIFSDVFGYVDYTYNANVKNRIVMGSWMNEKYFPNIRNELISDFSVKAPLKPETHEMIKKVRESNSVCIHIRLGDYLDPKWSYLNVCTAKYYQDSVDLIKQNVDNPSFFVFSNSSKDIQWIKENYSFLKDCYFVDLSNDDYEDLEIMKNCKHFVISNSTYSWWAQYLSQFEGKIVIAPDVWQKHNGVVGGYKKNGETLGIYQDSWKIIPVE